ncbi:MAG: hypothetical protein NTZ09_21150 [Candidatus Hydrogenedentes bacterium]|nr:hypothetical protein [Candidatus Hydrogenedentota bacterium]
MGRLILPILMIGLVVLALAAGAQCVLFEESYGDLLRCSSADVAVWWASSGWKISQTRPARAKTADAVTISGGRQTGGAGH